MILQSSENGGTVGGDTPARVAWHGATAMLSWHHHHRHVPSGGHATGSCRAVAGTAVRRFGLVAGDVCGVDGQMFYVRYSENILRGERGGQRNGGRKKNRV